MTVRGEEILCTPGHPFYSPVKGWTEACRLRAGDILVLVNGEYVVVEQVQHELLEAPIQVYNFEVEDFHTYFVSEAAILVHNKCGDFKKANPQQVEQSNNLPEGTFHREIKPEIMSQVPPSYKVGRNPDILINKAGEIAYQGANGRGFQLTGLYLQKIIAMLR